MKLSRSDMDEQIRLRATTADCLAMRIAENQGAQETDLLQWIFERVKIAEGATVLELCCGTGSQTVRLCEHVGAGGRVVAVDISPEALRALKESLSEDQRQSVQTVEATLESFAETLSARGFAAPAFDAVFCAYGLYYSRDAVRTLEEARRWLKPGGQIVIVGPFGPNNEPLFNLLEQHGVCIPPAVTFTSAEFMSTVVVPWAARHFRSVALHTLVNPIRWNSPQKILNYWRSSTFYRAEKEPAIEAAAAAVLREQGEFVNEKWIMLARMTDAR